MIIFGWPIKVNWFLIFSQNIFNQSAGVSCSCLVMEVCLWLIGRAWLVAGVLGRPDASLSLADVTSSRPLIGQKWQAPGARRLVHQWPRRRPGPGPHGQGWDNADLSLVNREAPQASDWLQRSDRVETSHLAHYWSCLDHGNQNTLRINFRPQTTWY